MPDLTASTLPASENAPNELTYDCPVCDNIDSGAIEYFIQGKQEQGAKANARCEDGLFYSNHFLAVFDGATDSSSREYEGKKSGRIARDIIIGVFRELPPDASKEDILEKINQSYQLFYRRHASLDFVGNPHWRPTATLIWYSFARRELVAIADSKARVDGMPYNTESKLVDILNSELRVRVIETLNLTEKELATNDLGRLYIAPLIERQFQFQNNPDAPPAFQYWAIDGFPIPADRLLIWHFQTPPAVIELSTDGYEYLPDGSTVIAYEEELKKMLQDDPLRIKAPATKGLQQGHRSFDDRAVLIYKRHPQ